MLHLHLFVALFTGVKHAHLVFSMPVNGPVNGPSKTSKTVCISMPGWMEFRPTVVPVLDHLFKHRLGIADWESKIMRMQLALMPAKSNIKSHRDSTVYATVAHRIHIPLFVPKCVQFYQFRGGFQSPSSGDDTGTNSIRKRQWIELTGQERLNQTGECCNATLAMQKHKKKAIRMGSKTLFSYGEWLEVPFKEGEAFEINNLLQHKVDQTGPYDRITMIIDLADKPCEVWAVLNPNSSAEIPLDRCEALKSCRKGNKISILCNVKSYMERNAGCFLSTSRTLNVSEWRGEKR